LSSPGGTSSCSERPFRRDGLAPERGRPLPPQLAQEVYAIIARVDALDIRRLMFEGIREIEQDAKPAGRTAFGRLRGLLDKWR
jgi:hypothetical protein